MGLRTKISLLGTAVLAALALTVYLGLIATMQPAFDDLEDRSSRVDLARAQHNLEGQLESLSRFSFDWSTWDEAYEYMQGTNPDFPPDNIEPLTLAGLDINWLALYDQYGQLAAGLYIDLSTGDPHPVPLSTLRFDERALTRLKQHDSETSEILGMIDSGVGPLIVSSRPITQADSTGPILGTMIFGRLIDDARLAEMSRDAEVNASLTRIEQGRYSTGLRDQFGEISQTVTALVRFTSVELHDVLGRQIASLQVQSPREISALGANTTMSTLLILLVVGGITIVLAALIIGAVIVAPTRKLQQVLARIEENNDTSVRIRLGRNDEIGDLARSIDSMLGRLDDLKQQSIEQSFKAGMAEVAAGLLHNVRNALMPAINNVAMAREAMIRRSDDNLSLAFDEIGASGTDTERRKKLLKFVASSHERSVQKRAEAIDYLANVLDQLDQAAEAVKAQEKFANPKPVFEHVKLGEVLDISLGVIPADVMTGVEVIIGTEARGIRVSVHRVPLMQVIGNVLMNAVDSILETGSSVGRISIDARRVDGGSKVALTIKDDGAGMSVDKLERLFERDFTTKEGVRGLGLHWSANALSGMGATISASSDGPGHGAEFRILLQATKPGTMANG